MATRSEKHQALTAASPSREQAELIEVKLKASTGRGDAKNTQEFSANMPASLADAIAAEGVDAVFKRYLSSLAIELQGEQRSKMAPEGEKKERKRASYLEELGV